MIDKPSGMAVPVVQKTTATEAVSDEFEDARVMARQGNKINAIKIVRERTGWSLKEAKDFVESPAFGVPITANASSAGAGCLILIVMIGGAIWWVSNQSSPATVSYPESSSSYSEVDAEVGCKSPYSSEKKTDIFKNRYRDHLMTWSGTVELSSASDVSVNIDGKGFQDLAVDLADKKAGYELQKGVG